MMIEKGDTNGDKCELWNETYVEQELRLWDDSQHPLALIAQPWNSFSSLLGNARPKNLFLKYFHLPNSLWEELEYVVADM